MLDRTSPGGNEVLPEYGTGTGRIALEFFPSVKKSVAVDPSKEMPAYLRRKLDAASITTVVPLAWSIGSDPSPVPRFDSIVSPIYHHVPDTPHAAEVL
ncbi:MAG: class I SAM-dependent methyltransferase [Methanospirillum sp.]